MIALGIVVLVSWEEFKVKDKVGRIDGLHSPVALVIILCGLGGGTQGTVRR